MKTLTNIQLEIQATGGTFTLDLIDAFMRINDIVYQGTSTARPFTEYMNDVREWVLNNTAVLLTPSEVYSLVCHVGQEWQEAKKNFVGSPTSPTTTS